MVLKGNRSTLNTPAAKLTYDVSDETTRHATE